MVNRIVKEEVIMNFSADYLLQLKKSRKFLLGVIQLLRGHNITFFDHLPKGQWILKAKYLFLNFSKKKNEKFYPISENTSIVHVVSERPPMPISFQKRALFSAVNLPNHNKELSTLKTFFPSLLSEFAIFLYGATWWKICGF